MLLVDTLSTPLPEHCYWSHSNQKHIDLRSNQTHLIYDVAPLWEKAHPPFPGQASHHRLVIVPNIAEAEAGGCADNVYGAGVNRQGILAKIGASHLEV